MRDILFRIAGMERGRLNFQMGKSFQAISTAMRQMGRVNFLPMREKLSMECGEIKSWWRGWTITKNDIV